MKGSVRCCEYNLTSKVFITCIINLFKPSLQINHVIFLNFVTIKTYIIINNTKTLEWNKKLPFNPWWNIKQMTRFLESKISSSATKCRKKKSRLERKCLDYLGNSNSQIGWNISRRITKYNRQVHFHIWQTYCKFSFR